MSPFKIWNIRAYRTVEPLREWGSRFVISRVRYIRPKPHYNESVEKQPKCSLYRGKVIL